MYTEGKYFIITLEMISFALAAEGRRTDLQRPDVDDIDVLFIYFIFKSLLHKRKYI